MIFTTERCRTYEWSQSLRDHSSDWKCSQKIQIDVGSDCEVYSQVRYTDVSYVNISVIKTNAVPIKAQISITLDSNDNHSIMKHTDAWTQKCDFLSVSVTEETTLINVKLQLYDSLEISAFGTPQPFNLFNDLQQFLMQPTLSDIKIIIGNEEIAAHKVILSAHSPVLLSMFEADMREKNEGRVVIKDIAIDVMRNVLTYLYTGSDSFLDDVTMALTELKKLKDLCEYKLSKQITILNVLQILDEADTHSAEKLKKSALHFIVENKYEIVGEDNFEALCHKKPQLMVSFMKEAIKK